MPGAALLMEAERRGILPPDKQMLLNEARRRGLVESAAPQVASPRGERSGTGPEVDLSIGAPARVRALVGGSDDPADRLATLRKFFPDAQPDAMDPGNFVFTDLESGKITRLNPKGADLGDVASVAREATQVGGGVLGAALGIPGGIPGIAAGSTLGTAAGEEAFNLAAQAGGLEDTRELAARAKKTALIGAAGLGGPVTGAAAGAGSRGALKGLFRGGAAGRQEAARAIEDLKPFGVSPSVAQATQKPLLDSVESFLSRMPGGAGVIREASKKTQSRIAAVIERKAARLAGGKALEPEVAGRVVIEGIEGPGGFIGRFKDRADGLFRGAEKLLSGEIQIGNTRAMLDELANKIPDLPALNDILTNPSVRRIAEALPEDALDIGVLKQLRSAIGSKIANPSLIDDIPRGELKRLYGAITADMEVAAKATSPKAFEAFRRANRFYAAGLKRIEDNLEPLIRNKVPERVFASLESGARQGPTQLRRLRRSLTNEQWKLVAAAVTRRLGTALPSQQGAEGGAFSLQTFLTNWNRLDKAAKAELFNAPGIRLMRSDLDALARASERARESSQAFFNPSGTAGAGIGQVMIFAQAAAVPASLLTGDLTFMAVGALSVTLAAGGGNLSARLMTNPNFVRWLGTATRIKLNGLGAHIGRLAAVAAISDGEDKEAILDYLGLLRASGAGNQ